MVVVESTSRVALIAKSLCERATDALEISGLILFGNSIMWPGMRVVRLREDAGFGVMGFRSAHSS